jgi:hypothetical protein
VIGKVGNVWDWEFVLFGSCVERVVVLYELERSIFLFDKENRSGSRALARSYVAFR